MKANSKKENLKEKENSFKIMDKVFMKENSKMILNMEKESLLTIIISLNIQEHLIRVKWKVLTVH